MHPNGPEIGLLLFRAMSSSISEGYFSQRLELRGSGWFSELQIEVGSSFWLANFTGSGVKDLGVSGLEQRPVSRTNSLKLHRYSTSTEVLSVYLGLRRSALPSKCVT
jgi:hypothetical protein